MAGLIGGIVGSTAMTVVMKSLHRRLPPEDRYPLPPRHVAMALAEKSGVGVPSSEKSRTNLTLAAHYSYGTTLGVAYSLIAPRGRWAPLAAVPFGLAVWSGSYLGWLPAVGLHPSATEESAARNSLMIASHLVWAGTIAAVVHAMDGAAPEGAPREGG